MNARRLILKPWLLAAGFVLVSAIGAQAATTDISSMPLVISSPSSVLPNLMFVLDDSGSMDYDYLPDWVNDSFCRSAGATSTSSGSFSRACDGTGYGPQPPFRSAGFNGVYYNPAITYLPPLDSNAASYMSQTSANTLRLDFGEGRCLWHPEHVVDEPPHGLSRRRVLHR